MWPANFSMDLYQFMVLLIVLSDIQPPRQPSSDNSFSTYSLRPALRASVAAQAQGPGIAELLVIYALRGPPRSLLIPIRLLDRDTDRPLPRKVTVC